MGERAPAGPPRPWPASTASAAERSAQLSPTSCSNHTGIEHEDIPAPELPVTLNTPGKVAGFLRTAELEPAERTALHHGVTVRRGQRWWVLLLSVPGRQRASDASLLRRLEAATRHNRQLEAENRELRETLTLALGERRTADLPRRRVVERSLA